MIANHILADVILVPEYDSSLTPDSIHTSARDEVSRVRRSSVPESTASRRCNGHKDLRITEKLYYWHANVSTEYM